MSSPLPPLPPVESSRLVTLSDGRPGLRGGIHVEIREPSPTQDPGHGTQDCSHCLDFIASDETLDRYDEIISAAGWQLDSYQKNPVFQNAHKYGDIIFTLGKAIVTEIRGSARSIPSPGEEGQGEGGTVRASSGGAYLFQRVEFAVDVNPMAKIAYGLYKGKFLNAVSVGFVPVRWEDGTQTTSYRRKYLEQELLEVSAVGIPANPNALALGLKSGAIETSDIKDTLELLRSYFDSEFKVQMASPARTSKLDVQSSAPPPNHQLILQLTRDLHTLLKHT